MFGNVHYRECLSPTFTFFPPPLRALFFTPPESNNLLEHFAWENRPRQDSLFSSYFPLFSFSLPCRQVGLFPRFLPINGQIGLFLLFLYQLPFLLWWSSLVSLESLYPFDFPPVPFRLFRNIGNLNLFFLVSSIPSSTLCFSLLLVPYLHQTVDLFPGPMFLCQIVDFTQRLISQFFLLSFSLKCPFLVLTPGLSSFVFDRPHPTILTTHPLFSD